MSLEAITSITEAEESARRIRAEAAAAARKAAADARERGEQRIAEAAKKAEAEVEELAEKTRAQAQADADELAQSTENKKAAMRAHAEARLDKAANLIVERIVKA